MAVAIDFSVDFPFSNCTSSVWHAQLACSAVLPRLLASSAYPTLAGVAGRVTFRSIMLAAATIALAAKYSIYPKTPLGCFAFFTHTTALPPCSFNVLLAVRTRRIGTSSDGAAPKVQD
jgi:hypothetical protein